MKIQRISVESFGRIIGREFELEPGLNVFYGPNESGKTTLMEFIRSITVPTNKRSQYPERAKSNSGIIEAEEDGRPYVIQLDYRQRKGEVPECIANMDPDMYRAMHAMSFSDLDNDSAVTNKEIYSKYLTIPGGEVVPEVMKSIDDRMAVQIGTTPKSSSELNTCQTSIENSMEKTEALRVRSIEYTDLADERDSLESELESLKEYNERARISNSEADRADAQKELFTRLDQLRAKRDAIRSKPLADEKADEKHRGLVSQMASKEAAFATIDGQREAILRKLPSDEDKIRGLLQRYSAAEKAYPEYIERRNRPPVTTMVKNKFNPVMAVLGAAIMAAGAVPFVMNMDKPTIIAAACVAAGIAVIGLYAAFRPKHEETVRDLGNEKWIEDYESELVSLMDDSGMKHLSAESDIDSLNGVTKVLADLDGNMPLWSKANTELLQANNEMSLFLTPYGGEEGYQRSKEDYRELLACESGIEAVSESIRSAGYDPEKPFPAIERMALKEQEQIEVSKRIGLLDERLDSLIRDGELDQEIDRLSSLTARRDAVLREGAISVLSSHIMDSACSDLYKTVKPEVLKTASEYLSMMTYGAYTIDSDPRNPELTVLCDGMKKTLKQCSSGTRSQILLSLKLAVAKKMCGGKVPMILDDVLITFDSVRAEGACRALAKISSEMQVLLFTCSDTVMKICEGIPEANVIRM